MNSRPAAPRASRRLKASGLAVAALASACIGLGVNSAALPAAALPLTGTPTLTPIGPFHLIWSRQINDPGQPIAGSSPASGNLDGAGPAVIVGDRSGRIYAMHLADGSNVPGWPYNGGIAVDSTASVTGAGATARVFVGVGNSAKPTLGGYLKLSNRGKPMFMVRPRALPGITKTKTVGVQSSLSVGVLNGAPGVVSGAMGQMGYALTTANGKVVHGFPWFQADTNFTTPALANLFGTGNMIIEGGDSTAGRAFGQVYLNGGHLRILRTTGHTGSPNPTRGLVCQYSTDQVVQSSPAVGAFLPGGRTGITFGTGAFYKHAGSTNVIFTVDDQCRPVWAAGLDGLTTASPALADVRGVGQLDVVEGTRAGSVYALRGTDGAQLWKTTLPHQMIGSVTTVSLDGRHQDVLAPTLGGVYVLDGRTGAVRYHIASEVAMQNAPLVTVDANGAVGLTIAGYEAHGGRLYGQIQHWQISGAPAASVHAFGSWPMFHHDSQLTGSTGVNPNWAALHK
jgi:outer membrane protein assembly factor BamB